MSNDDIHGVIRANGVNGDAIHGTTVNVTANAGMITGGHFGIEAATVNVTSNTGLISGGIAGIAFSDSADITNLNLITGGAFGIFSDGRYFHAQGGELGHYPGDRHGWHRHQCGHRQRHRQHRHNSSARRGRHRHPGNAHGHRDQFRMASMASSRLTRTRFPRMTSSSPATPARSKQRARTVSPSKRRIPPP